MHEILLENILQEGTNKNQLAHDIINKLVFTANMRIYLQRVLMHKTWFLFEKFHW